MAVFESILFTHTFISIGNAYHLALSMMEYPNASHYCHNFCGSELASIHSQAQMDEAVEVITRNAYTTNNVWIGLHDNAINNKFQWDDGTAFDFGSTTDTNGYILRGEYPWRSNEPDINSTDNFVAIEATRNNEWVDKRHWYNYHFLCDSCSGSIERYVVLNGYRDFAAAQQECADTYQTSLASIHSIWDMYEAVMQCQGVAYKPTGAGCWIGLQNEGDDDLFAWYDGLDWDYATDTTTYPWSTAGSTTTSGGGDIGDCIQMDPADNYLWRRIPCSNTTGRTLCNRPSEICTDEQWFTLPADSVWTTTKKPCLVASDLAEGGTSMALIGDKQFVNEDEMLKIDMVFNIDRVGYSGSAGVVLFIDGECGDFYYVGIWAEYDILFVGKFVEDQWTLIADVSLEEAFDYTKHYALQIELYHGFEWTVSLNTKLMIDNVTDDSFNNRGNTESGHLGIRNVNSSLTVHSFFVSGSIEYEDDLDFYFKCVPPTGSPTATPTPAPTQSPVPTLPPTPTPTSDTTTSEPTPLPSDGGPTTDPTSVTADISHIDNFHPSANVEELAVTQSNGSKQWMLVAMAVILVLLAISVLFCYRQCTKQRGPPEVFDGVSGTGINQRKQTADNSVDEDEDEENDEFVDTDEEEVLTVEITPEAEPVQEL